MKGLKKLRRLFALLMAMIMVMGTCITTQAADTGSITITNAAVGKEYSIYKMFDLTYNETTGSYSYKVNYYWQDFFGTGGAGADYVDVTENSYYVTWKEGADVEELAKAALENVENLNSQYYKNYSKTAEAETKTLKFENLEYGYYLVSTTSGSVCNLETANSDIKITDKNITPTVRKLVKEDSTGDYEESNTAEIGDKVNFRTEIENAYGQSNLVLHDVMDGGLTLDEDTGIEVSSGESLDKAELVSSDYYTIVTDSASLEDGCTFEVKFADEFTATLTSSDIIYVAYTAKVNTSAEIGSEVNKNKAYVEYGDEQTSTEDTTNTGVYSLYLWKYDAATGEALEGAVFYLYDRSGKHNNLALALDEENKVKEWTGQVNDGNGTLLKSDSNGLIEIIGLDAGDYGIDEWSAPDGYNGLPESIELTIEENGDVKIDGNVINDTIEIGDKTYNVIKIANSGGNEMPSTGGIGTTIFYVIGSIMALGAAVVLITRRRMHES